MAREGFLAEDLFLDAVALRARSIVLRALWHDAIFFAVNSGRSHVQTGP